MQSLKKLSQSLTFILPFIGLTTAIVYIHAINQFAGFAMDEIDKYERAPFVRMPDGSILLPRLSEEIRNNMNMPEYQIGPPPKPE